MSLMSLDKSLIFFTFFFLQDKPTSQNVAEVTVPPHQKPAFHNHHDSREELVAHPIENSHLAIRQDTLDSSRTSETNERHQSPSKHSPANVHLNVDHHIDLPPSSVSSPIAAQMDIDEPQEVRFVPTFSQHFCLLLMSIIIQIVEAMAVPRATAVENHPDSKEELVANHKENAHSPPGQEAFVSSQTIETNERRRPKEAKDMRKHSSVHLNADHHTPIEAKMDIDEPLEVSLDS